MELINIIDRAIEEEYKRISSKKSIKQEIDSIYKNIRWERPELAIYVRKKLEKMAAEKATCD